MTTTKTGQMKKRDGGSKDTLHPSALLLIKVNARRHPASFSLKNIHINCEIHTLKEKAPMNKLSSKHERTVPAKSVLGLRVCRSELDRYINRNF
jgi:hypothetical protein